MCFIVPEKQKRTVSGWGFIQDPSDGAKDTPSDLLVGREG